MHWVSSFSLRPISLGRDWHHGEDLAGRVDCCSVLPDMIIGGRVLLYKGIHVGDGHQDPDRVIWKGFSHRQLAQVPIL